MKTYTLYLEDYDDVDSVKDKMGWGRADRILLILPARGENLGSKLDLTLLKRQSQNLGIILGIVARNRDIQDRARALNIPVFRSVRQAHKSPWEIEAFNEPKTTEFNKRRERIRYLKEKIKRPLFVDSVLEKPSIRFTSFSLGIAAFLSVAALVLPRAEIRITPDNELQEITLTVMASEDITSYNLSGALPMQVIYIVVEGRESIQSSGTMQIPEQAAQGEVVFSNLTDKPIEIPRGTTILTLNEGAPNFVTTEFEELPGVPGASISVSVSAVDPGSGGNLPSGSLEVIDGVLGLDIRVTNPNPTSGGSERQGPAPTADDFQQLRAQLISSLGDNALAEVRSNLLANDFVVTDNPKINIVLEEKFSPAEPQPANELSLLLRVEYEIIVIRRVDLEGMLAAILDRNMPDGFTTSRESLIINHLTSPSFNEEGTASWELIAKRSITPIIYETDIIMLAQGKSKTTATKLLFDRFALAVEPEILLFPKWWPYIPIVPLRIGVDTQ